MSLPAGAIADRPGSNVFHPSATQEKRNDLLSKIGAFLLTLLVAAFAGATNLQAAITGSTGDVSLIAPPPSVQINALSSDTTIFGFAEAQNFTLMSDLPINGSGAGIHVGTGNPATAFVSSGVDVDNYFFHVDSVATSVTRFFGTISFDREILGIIFERRELNNSDPTLGLPGTSYPTLERNSNFREFERGGSCGTSVVDCATISNDLQTITLDLGTTTQIDHIRVVTAAVPEPGTMLLLGSGIASFVSSGYRRKNRG